MAAPDTTLQIRSLVTKDGVLELSLARAPIPALAADEVLVQVEATPINPSDLGLLIGAGDVSAATSSGSGETTVVRVPVSAPGMRFMAARIGQSMTVGNEGAGTVVAAGAAAEAQALKGKRVALWGGSLYATHRVAKAADVMPLPADISAAEGASCFVNPLTALGMVGTMRREGHSALIHTAAASNLGQMLVKLCREEKIPLVNIVRKPEQEEILRSVGATHILNSSAPDFQDRLTDAVGETGATLAFDAIGGGKLANQILLAIEAAASRKAGEYSRYGSNSPKQVYIYGALDVGPTELTRSYGLTWGLGGWLLTNFLMKCTAAERQALRDRVVAGLKSTFASHYTQRITLAEALNVDTIRAYNRKATGEKYLIEPQR